MKRLFFGLNLKIEQYSVTVWIFSIAFRCQTVQYDIQRQRYLVGTTVLANMSPSFGSFTGLRFVLSILPEWNISIHTRSTVTYPFNPSVKGSEKRISTFLENTHLPSIVRPSTAWIHNYWNTLVYIFFVIYLQAIPSFES